MSDYYWELAQYDGTVTPIPPEAVDAVKRRWDAGQPIHLSKSGISIPASQIKSFRQSTRPANQPALLESAAAAFNEPVLNPDGSVVCRWVKKVVPQHQYKYYGAHAAYKKLAEDGATVTVAMFLPVETIDLNKVDYCSAEETAQLERQRRPRET